MSWKALATGPDKYKVIFREGIVTKHRIAVCTDEKDAQRIASALNMADKMVDVLRGGLTDEEFLRKVVAEKS